MTAAPKTLLFCILLFTATLTAHAQFGIGTTNPQAALDVTSTTKGMLIPRMTTAQRVAISSPASSTLVFDTDLGEFYFYTGSAWTSLVSAKEKIMQVFKKATSQIIPFATSAADVTWSSVAGNGTALTFVPSTGVITLPANKTFLVTGYLALGVSTVSKFALSQILDGSNLSTSSNPIALPSTFKFSTKSLVLSSNEPADDSDSGPAIALINTGASPLNIKLRILKNGSGDLVIAGDNSTYAGSYLLVQEL